MADTVIFVGPPRPILETNRPNPDFDTSQPDWASRICSGNTFPTWKQVLDPEEELDFDVVGVSGTALVPNISEIDLPFIHPFGSDFEFYIALDPQYEKLLSPGNAGPDPNYADAIDRARRNLVLPVPNGVLGVEIDQDLVSQEFREWLAEGDRVAVFGRWIVDCGHDDFHAEIHPPLLMAAAKPIHAGRTVDQPAPAGAGPADGTFVKFISRPYLVGQNFGDGFFDEHIAKEGAKVEGIIFFPLSLQMEAHPPILEKPFGGVQILNVTVRPPAPRAQPGDQLLVSFHFTVRRGCAVQVFNAGSDSVGVTVVLNDASYEAPPLPERHDVSFSLDDLNTLDPDHAAILADAIGVSLFANPAAAAILARGIATDRYDAPQAVSVQDAENIVIAAPINTLRSGMGFSVDDSQVFPLYGWLNVAWKRDLSNTAIGSNSH